MALLDRFKKKTKKQEVQEPKEERPAEILKEEKPKEEEPKKKEPKRIISRKTEQAYRLIKESHITEKATSLAEQNKYIFKISPQANKTEVKKAIEALYEVKVAKVHLIHSPAKKRRLGRSEGWRGGLKRGFKKVIVTLKKGEKIEVLPR